MIDRSVFVIGATGLIGGAVARHLCASGRAVSGLARSSDAADQLEASGIVPIRGNLGSGMPAVVAHAATVDAVVLAAQLDGTTERALAATSSPSSSEPQRSVAETRSLDSTLPSCGQPV